jgi:hypothetical protein
VARPTEPRDSYASGIRIPHSSPSHEATHTWLSGSVSRQASPSARNEEKTRLHAKIHTCSGPDSHNEQTPALKVPLQTELRFHPAGTNNPPHWRACGATKPLVARRRPLRSSDDDLRSRWTNSSSDGLRADAAATRPSPTSPLEGRGQAIKAKEPEARSPDGGGDPVGDEDFFSRHHLSADDGSHLPTGRSPLGSSRTGEHRPPRRGVVPGQRQDSPRTRTPP